MFLFTTPITSPFNSLPIIPEFLFAATICDLSNKYFFVGLNKVKLASAPSLTLTVASPKQG